MTVLNLNRSNAQPNIGTQLTISPDPNSDSAYQLTYINCRPGNPNFLSQLREQPRIRLHNLTFGKTFKTARATAKHLQRDLPAFLPHVAVIQLEGSPELSAAEILGRDFNAGELIHFDQDLTDPWYLYNLNAQPGTLHMDYVRLIDADGNPITAPAKSDYVSLSVQGIEQLQIAFCADDAHICTTETVTFNFRWESNRSIVTAETGLGTTWANQKRRREIALAATSTSP